MHAAHLASGIFSVKFSASSSKNPSSLRKAGGLFVGYLGCRPGRFNVFSFRVWYYAF